MPIFRRTLTVAAVTAASTFAFSLPAWAHIGEFTRDCGHVTLALTRFGDGENTVHVFRNGKELAPLHFTGTTLQHTYDEGNDGTVVYQAVWYESETSDHVKGQTKRQVLYPPKGCESPSPTPTPTNTGSPTATTTNSPATPSSTPSTQPVVAPATPTPTPASTTSSPAEASKLANTGAGNAVPLAIVGGVLLAGGVGLTVFTRRRRSSTAS